MSMFVVCSILVHIWCVQLFCINLPSQPAPRMENKNHWNLHLPWLFRFLSFAFTLFMLSSPCPTSTDYTYVIEILINSECLFQLSYLSLRRVLALPRCWHNKPSRGKKTYDNDKDIDVYSVKGFFRDTKKVKKCKGRNKMCRFSLREEAWQKRWVGEMRRSGE